MNTFRPISSFLGLFACMALGLLEAPRANAQIALPVTTPISTATPVPVDTPAPSPTPTGTLVIRVVPLSASVQLSPAGTASTPSASSVSKAPGNNVTTQTVNNPLAPAFQSLQVSSADLFSPTKLSPQPEMATVTLTYSTAYVGTQVQVAPLDGGSINGSAGAKTVAVAADGTLAFSFQAPSGPGRYHVITRLGTTEIAFPFDVADPTLPTPSPSSLSDSN